MSTVLVSKDQIITVPSVAFNSAGASLTPAQYDSALTDALIVQTKASATSQNGPLGNSKIVLPDANKGGFIVITGTLSNTTGLAHMEVTRAAGIGGVHVPLGRDTSVAGKGSTNNASAALIETLNTGTNTISQTEASTRFQLLIDARTGEEFKVRLAGVAAGGAVSFEVGYYEPPVMSLSL